MSNEPKRSEDSTPLYSKNSGQITPFETIRRTNPAGNEFWSSRDFARVLGYVNYRHFQAVIEKARTACFNSGQRVEDHFVGTDQMIELSKGGQRAVKTVMMSRYANWGMGLGEQGLPNAIFTSSLIMQSFIIHPSSFSPCSAAPFQTTSCPTNASTSSSPTRPTATSGARTTTPSPPASISKQPPRPPGTRPARSQTILYYGLYSNKTRGQTSLIPDHIIRPSS